MLDLASQRDLPAVLLVDDDLVSREVTATLLTMSGYTTYTAESGEGALDMLTEGLCRPGVILMDAQMPGLSGTELIAKLRAALPGAVLYVISGSQPPPPVVAAADGMLLKPFQAAELRKLLEGRPAKPTASFLDPGEPELSVETLSQLRQLMPESAVREILEATVADLTRRTEALGAAISRHDADEVRRIGHAIKGGCGMAGAVQAARLGALLETGSDCCGDNHLDNSRALLRDLRAAARGLQRILNGELPA